MSVILGDAVGAIGETKQSMLSLTQFQAQYGAGWVIADGSSCAGSQYATISGNSTLPDCRGYFIRGKDNGAGHNPDGEQALGAFQAYQNANHNHGVSDSGHSHTVGRVCFTTNTTHEHAAGSSPSGGGSFAEGPNPFNGTSSGTPSTLSATTGIGINNSGGDESRPSVVTMNLFIRIN